MYYQYVLKRVKIIKQNIYELLDIDYNQYDCPDKEFDTQIILPSQYLQKICGDMENLSDIVEVN